MMMDDCGIGIMVFHIVAGLLVLSPLASLIVLVWAPIGRLRQDSLAGTSIPRA